MIKYNIGDIFTVTKGIILHGCNAQGVMGAGVAAQVRKRWPEVYNKYREWCLKALKDKISIAGTIQYVQADENLFIANGITQINSGADATSTWITHVLYKAFVNANFQSDSMPLHTVCLGCGIGGLDWKRDVEPIFKRVEHGYPKVDATVWSLA